MKKLDNGLYEICAEHGIVWPSDDVSCRLCKELGSVGVPTLNTEGMTQGDLQAEIDNLLGHVAQNLQKFGKP